MQVGPSVKQLGSRSLITIALYYVSPILSNTIVFLLRYDKFWAIEPLNVTDIAPFRAAGVILSNGEVT